MATTLCEHVPAEVSLSQETASYLQRHFSAEMDVVLARHPGVYRITPGPYVGTVVGPDIELRIRPKFGTTVLFYLLSYAYRLARIRKDLVTHEEVQEIREFLLAILAGQLEELLRLGLRRDYLEHSEDVQVVRGRLLLETMLRRMPTRDLTMPCRFEEFTSDVPHNQVLRFTLERIAPPSDMGLRGRIQRCRRVLSRVSMRLFTPMEIDAFVYNRLNAHYESLHQLCSLLLEGAGLEQEVGRRPVSSFLVNMNKVFEKFVAGWLREHLAPPLTLADQWSGRLDVGGHLPIQPDLLIFRNGVPAVVADTKYKSTTGGKPHPADAYQILAYCRALDLPTGVLVYSDAFASPRRFPVSTGANTIEAFGMDLGGNVDDLERRMGLLRERLGEVARRVPQT